MGFERNRVPSFPLLIFVIDRTIKLIEVESLCQIHDNEGETKNQIIKFQKSETSLETPVSALFKHE